MDDLHERMAHLSRRVDTAAAPDLERVRERHTRRRRTSALVVGVALAAIVALLAVQMLRPSAPSVPAASQDPSSGTLTVWPEAEDGDEPWRGDPEQLITHFAQTVLGWSTPDLTVVMIGGPLGDSDSVAQYELRPEECPDTARCTPPLTVSTVETGPDVWSIQVVTHPDLAIEVGVADPAVALTGGSRIRFDLTFADDRAAHIGMVASNGCRQATAFDVGLDAGSHILELPAVTADDPGCEDLGTGYLFAYTMDDTTVPTGDPLLEAAAIEYPWLTVVPIYLQMEEPDATSTSTPAGVQSDQTLEVTCSGTDVEVSDLPVRAGRAGVMVSFTASEGGSAPAMLSVDGGIRVDPGTSLVALPPGSHTARCQTSGDFFASEGAEFDVIDPQGYWTDPSVDCAPPDSIEEATPVTGPASWEDMLVWATLPENLPDGFPIVRARFVGYPESDPTRTIGMFLDPDDQLIRRVNVVRLGPDEWTVETVTCPIT